MDLYKTSELTEKGSFRKRIQNILSQGNSSGYRLIVHNALWTREQLEESIAKGYDTREASGHLAGPDGLATGCDLVDARFLWGAPRHVWVFIGYCALSQGCEWGGFRGLPRSIRSRLLSFLTRQDPPFDPKEWRGPIGWAPAYVGIGRR
jgi:hypothetical protein